MIDTFEQSIKRLWLAYKLYHSVAVRNGSDGNQYATDSTNDYLKYLQEATSGEMAFNWDIPQAIENQVRIVRGMVECYDRPVVRDKFTNKTRWSL